MRYLLSLCNIGISSLWISLFLTGMNWIWSISSSRAIKRAGIIPPFVMPRIIWYFFCDLCILAARFLSNISTSSQLQYTFGEVSSLISGLWLKLVRFHKIDLLNFYVRLKLKNWEWTYSLPSACQMMSMSITGIVFYQINNGSKFLICTSKRSLLLVRIAVECTIGIKIYQKSVFRVRWLMNV